MESYPPTPVTNYGVTLLKEGIEPHITYISPDGDMAFYLNGGLAPWPGVTEGVVLTDGMSGMHPTFEHLDHKGARQDGATWADTVYDPAEIIMEVQCTARTPENLRKVMRKWFAAWDPQKKGTLSWVTPDGGEWWCHPRLNRAPIEKMNRAMARGCHQEFKWNLRNDDAFWRSHDSVHTFQYRYNAAEDLFNRDDSGTLGANWSQTYSGGISGICETEDGFFGNDRHGRAKWVPAGTTAREVLNRWLGVNEVQTVTVTGSPSTWNLTFGGQTTASIAHPASAATVQTRLENLSNIGVGDVSVAGSSGGPYTITFTGALGKQPLSEMTASILTGGVNPTVTVGTTTEGSRATTQTDNQIHTIRFGDFFEFPWRDTSYVDIWARMNTAGTTGLRCRIGAFSVTLSAFVGGVETILKQRAIFSPLWEEKWSFVVGTAKNARQYKVMRGGFTIINYTETGTTSQIGASYRGGGFGMKAGANGAGQITPASLDSWAMDDNATITQKGHITLTNFGDQEGYPDLIVYGPGTFKFGNGPDADPTITFGPLTSGQVALIKTKPGVRSVNDITNEPIDEDLPFFQNFIERLISFAFNGNIPPLVSWFESLFGISPPQGNMYQLLDGRFDQPIPPRPVAGLPEESHIAIEITGGDAETKVIAALTPLRRWPE